MKTTLIRCVNACMAVNYLSQMEWDYKTAFTLARLRRALQPSVDFYIREENKLTQEFGQLDEKGNVAFTERGTFLFKDPADAPEYNTRRFELANVGTEIDWKPAALPEPQKIKPIHLEALEGFIRFGGDDA